MCRYCGQDSTGQAFCDVFRKEKPRDLSYWSGRLLVAVVLATLVAKNVLKTIYRIIFADWRDDG